ncbi:hypothetical protein [Herbaspirillum sp. alder98]|uniref:hypothetical protein n=1 Tax=Herbaspirillum sp. alder98 TaxID=2913096 RepID=UPI001CD8533D|nr:hypothetical protein [Herbaspirillum sp. alder98]MCA1326779.1 hypothetical protein [Herbaspirillum sp. alder98]
MNDQLSPYATVVQFALNYAPAADDYVGANTVVPAAANIGVLYCEYTVTAVSNVANSSYTKSYVVTSSQRLILNNPTKPATSLVQSLEAGGPGMISNPNVVNLYAGLSGVSTNDQAATTGYYFYPVWAMNSVSMTVRQGVVSQSWLLNYQPRTLNSTVNVSSSSGNASSANQGNSFSNMSQKTTGASNTTTQSYDVSLSAGAMYGATASAGLAVSQTQDYSQSNSQGSDRSSLAGRSRQNAYNTGMTIKDWGIYSCLNAAGGAGGLPSCTWFMSQEFPYNFMANNATTNVTASAPTFPYNLELSAAEMADVFPRNYSSGTPCYQIAPPTELAVLGTDFVQTSSWQIDVDYPQSVAPELSPMHVVDAIFASHFTASNAEPGEVVIVGQLNPGQTVTFQPPAPLDLSLLALDPITDNSGSNGAVIGFLPSKFLVPVSVGALSRSISSANNLMVLTQGFAASVETRPGSNMVLTAALTDAAFSAQLNVCFKMSGFDGDLNLYLKHWAETSQQGCVLSIWFNPPGYTATSTGAPSAPLTKQTLPPDLTVTLNTTEGASGDNNLLVLNLRNTFYDTIDYHDYLQPGLNVIVIGVSASGSSAGYSLRAVAIGN